MSLVRVQSEEPYLEKPAQGNLSGLFVFMAVANADVNQISGGSVKQFPDAFIVYFLHRGSLVSRFRVMMA
ncbi:hypothetical protein BBB56_05790 [Candidatus Pantoea deserta]|uniref:Uncharacterized protein n=1 Tax=Candidatus Pantoea deserta TaxID=1869313 RepID=A0A3N4P3W3_9GAMM|nr:hypothetical protein BBB56_05790 [Pantoea deserta]